MGSFRGNCGSDRRALETSKMTNCDIWQASETPRLKYKPDPFAGLSL
jgi:hypothetical protein